MIKETKKAAMKNSSPFFKILPLLLTLCVVIIDQVTKYLVVKYIPLFHTGASFGGDLVRFIYVQNTAAAFSIGNSLSSHIRIILLKFIPVLAIIIAMVIYFRNNTLTALQRWAFCGVVGGGIGNLIDRIFRETGVVDFIDVKFFGIFGWERWPTFNVADSVIVICAILLIISVILSENQKKSHEQ